MAFANLREDVVREGDARPAWKGEGDPWHAKTCKGRRTSALQVEYADLKRAFENEVLTNVLGRHKGLSELFRSFDRDGNGVLDHQEFFDMMSKFVPGCVYSPVVRELAKEVDVDDSGEVSFSEFVGYVLRKAIQRQMRKPGGKNNLRALFEQFRQPGEQKGAAASIDADGLTDVMRTFLTGRAPREACGELLAVIDSSGNGSIEYGELLHFVATVRAALALQLWLQLHLCFNCSRLQMPSTAVAVRCSGSDGASHLPTAHCPLPSAHTHAHALHSPTPPHRSP
jgi:Ca2+-binding EF-hand superfamily protein